MSSHSNLVASTIGSFCLLVMELKSLADDWVRTGVCKLLSNLCCYELLSTSGFLRFDIYFISTSFEIWLLSQSLGLLVA